MTKKKIISFAGLDGAGKSTQIRIIKKFLEESGYKVKIQQHFSLPLGKKCEEIVKTSKDAYVRALAFALDEYLQKSDNISDSDYDVILCDRSPYCAYAYSKAQGVQEEWIKWLYMYSQECDICIYLDISIDTSYKRKGFDAVSPNLSDAQYRQVRDNYLQLVNTGKVVRIDAEQDFETVTRDIKTVVCEVLKIWD